MRGEVRGVFITGTDTDAGKTVFCAHLLAYLLRSGINAASQKWVQTGARDADDNQFHAKVSGAPESAFAVPQRFDYPASPQLAARLESRGVDIESIYNSYSTLSAAHKITLCEGSGGALVPVAEGVLIADIAANLGLPAVIVSANRLGCINHTLLTIESLRARKIDVLGIAFVRTSPDADETIAADNIRAVREFSGEKIIGEVGWMNSPETYSQAFDPIGAEFVKLWGNYNG